MKFLNKKSLMVILLFCGLIVFSGCVGTVVPTQVVSNGASFDNQGNRTSGFYGFYTNESTKVVYGVIAPEAKDRYNTLIESYGKKVVPPIEKDFGITDNKTNCLITLPALSDFATMNRWFKSGITPK